MQTIITPNELPEKVLPFLQDAHGKTFTFDVDELVFKPCEISCLKAKGQALLTFREAFSHPEWTIANIGPSTDVYQIGRCGIIQFERV